jgi:hypothetical protein
MLALAVIAAQLADLLTFICAATVASIDGESNPLARFVFVRWGFPGVIAYKAIGTAVILAALAGIHSPWREWMALVIVAVTLLAAGTNTLAVILTR